MVITLSYAETKNNLQIISTMDNLPIKVDKPSAVKQYEENSTAFL